MGKGKEMKTTSLLKAGLVTAMLLSAGSLTAEKHKNRYERAWEHHARALDSMKKGGWEEATWELRNAALWCPDCAWAHYELGMALSLKGVTDEVVAEYRKAVQLDPVMLPALVSLAGALDAKGERKQALKYWERALKEEKSPEVAERIKKRLAEPR
jgi:tetratricopeptide (TPR) repeat protein